MPYDPSLAARIRSLTAAEPDVTEKPMFGGLAFLIGGHVAVSASGRGGVMVRVDPAESERLVATTAAEVVVMRGRETAGWLRVGAAAVADDAALAEWVRRGVASARRLPPKG